MEVHVVAVPWSSHEAQVREVCEAVFAVELDTPVNWDASDYASSHVLALTQAGLAVGCVRLLASGDIDRLAVLEKYRRKHIGLSLLQTAIEQAKQLGCSNVHADVPVAITGLFARAGFLPEGHDFDVDGERQQKMALVLPVPFQSTGETAKPAIRPQEVGVDSQNKLLHFHGETACIEGLRQCLTESRRNVQIYSQYLDHSIFDNQQIVDELSRLVRRGGPTKLQILVHSSQLVVTRGHRLLELARRLGSKIAIRRVPSEIAHDEHCCVLWDERGYWLLPDYREYDALANLHDPVQARKLSERFFYHWARSKSDNELKELRL